MGVTGEPYIRVHLKRHQGHISSALVYEVYEVVGFCFQQVTAE
jgi:hypothetical protein